MSIFNYFSKKDTPLPLPNGFLNAVFPSGAIKSVNKEVEKVINESNKDKQKRGPYTKFTDLQEVLIGKRATEHSVTSSIRHFNKKYSEFDLKETTVRTKKVQKRIPENENEKTRGNGFGSSDGVAFKEMRVSYSVSY